MTVREAINKSIASYEAMNGCIASKLNYRILRIMNQNLNRDKIYISKENLSYLKKIY